MLCEVLLTSLWFLFVIFWVETISVWLFLSMFYQDRGFYHWGDGVICKCFTSLNIMFCSCCNQIFPQDPNLAFKSPRALPELMDGKTLKTKWAMVFADDPGQLIYMLSRVDTHMQTEMQT